MWSTEGREEADAGPGGSWEAYTPGPVPSGRSRISIHLCLPDQGGEGAFSPLERAGTVAGWLGSHGLLPGVDRKLLPGLKGSSPGRAGLGGG